MSLGAAVLIISLLWFFWPYEKARPEIAPPPRKVAEPDALIDPEYGLTELGQLEHKLRLAAQARRLNPFEQNW